MCELFALGARASMTDVAAITATRKRHQRTTPYHMRLGNSIRVEAAYGKLYVAGPGKDICTKVKGATYNYQQESYELLLTLDSLASLRKETGWPFEEFSACCSQAVLNWANAAHAATKNLRELHRRVKEGYRTPLPWFTPDPAKVPWEQQKVMATFATHLDGFGFICGTGTGKTRAAIEAARYKFEHNELDLVIVVAPKEVQWEWCDEVPYWTDDRYDAHLLEGSITNRAKQLSILGRIPMPSFATINYEAFWRMPDTFMELHKSGVRFGVAFDEMHRLRTPSAKRTKFGMKLASIANWRIGMTGTLILQGLQDIWSQWMLIDNGITFGLNFRQYKRRYMFEIPEQFVLTHTSDGLGIVGDKIRERSIFYRKEDCLDLPPQVFEKRQATLTKEQQRAYREMEEDLLARIVERQDGDIDAEISVAEAANQLVMMLRLTQITSGHIKTDDGKIHRFSPNPKMDTLVTFVNEQVTQESIIVWARYREDIEEICRQLKHHDPVWLYGGMKDAQRIDHKARFKSGKSKILVAHPASAGVGLNLQIAGTACYYSYDQNLEHREQSLGRNWRGGSIELHDKITVVDFMVRNSCDKLILDSLKGKKKIGQLVHELKQHIQQDLGMS